MQFSDEEKRQKVSAYYEMFASHSEQQIQQICEDLNWDEHSCIERLIETQPQSAAMATSQTSQTPQVAGNTAATASVESAENMTRWFSEKLSTKEQQQQPGKNNNNNSHFVTPKKYAAPAVPAHIKRSPSNNYLNNNNKQFNAICQRAKGGERVLIIMRGAPGSGKSSLAESLVRKCHLLDRHDLSEFVLSTDDYFRTPRGGYEFNGSQLPDAHAWNQRRVRQKAAAGWSPIIVDNTNTMIWEMQPYVQIAVQYGYMLELLEPQTSWSKSASKLAQRNVHGVPRENIQRMLERYERTSVPELIKLLKDTKYSVPLPQLRLQPPLPALPAPATPPLAPLQPESPFQLNVQAQSWVPYEQHAPAYWGVPQSKAAAAANSNEKSLLDLLRDEQPVEAQVAEEAEVALPRFQRHSLNCPHEATGFVLLRQMYPNKQLSGLWDLYVKCKGDIDWAVDILLKEDELNKSSDCNYDEADAVLQEEQFQCACACGNVNLERAPPIELLPSAGAGAGAAASSAQSLGLGLAKPQRQPRGRRGTAAAHKDIQLQIENCFVLGDEQYSEHTRKIRDIRNGILEQPLPLPPTEDVSNVITANEEDEPEPEEDEENNSLLEMELGESLIAQLRSNFEWEDGTLGEMLPAAPLPATKVFVPRQLAKQLYMLWLESSYNQMEEQRQQTLRDDEQFARLLKNPKYAECSESPSNVNELLDMELAWSIYSSEQQAAQQAAQQLKQQSAQQQPNDIATHLTKMKLCEKFPNVPRDTVLEIFSATGSSYSQTVEVLDSNVQSALSRDELYEQALKESAKLTAQAAQPSQENVNRVAAATLNSAPSKSPQLHEEAKCAALRDFEETRNLAAHHSQLKAECYLKAKQAVQRGNGSVALYYSEIAQLHKKKIDIFNHRAANCIMEVHKHTQNNPDLLDLHYLHTVEAISCLDLFLDRHITILRNCTRVYKHVFIITGRGLHSANGVSTIKNKVKSRLGERRLRWQEVNPGLLRVKVFSATRHSKNF